jgi:hypothetical protein
VGRQRDCLIDDPRPAVQPIKMSQPRVSDAHSLRSSIASYDTIVVYAISLDRLFMAESASGLKWVPVGDGLEDLNLRGVSLIIGLDRLFELSGLD